VEIIVFYVYLGMREKSGIGRRTLAVLG